MRNKKFNFQINVKNGLLFAVIAMMGLLTVSCNPEDSNTGSVPVAQPTPGTADVKLTAGGQEFKVIGPCGWANAAGLNYIGANQADNNLRTFFANFNIAQLPATTTTYTLVADTNDTDTNPTHITMSIGEVTTGSNPVSTSWNSKASSGTLTLVVDGNKITANLAGITLYPQTNSGFYINGNTGAFANNGALTGTLTFYKQ